jgi:lipid II:glycine glycyltransferase (peptidoglycan interpeptide bridge formation enzyme)
MDQRVGQVTYLPEGKDRINDRLLSLFGQKTRNLVRKALRQGFTVTCEETDEAWEFLRTTHEENMAAVGGTAKPKSHFMALRSVFAANCRVWQAQADGKFVAAVLLMYYQDTVEYFIPVVKREYRSRQPLSLLIFEAMKDAVVRGFKIWNWGGTWASQKSLHHFKAGFGAIDRPYKYYIITDVGIRDLLQNAKSEITRNFPNWYLYPYAEL